MIRDADFPYVVKFRRDSQEGEITGTKFAQKPKLQTQRFDSATVFLCVAVSPSQRFGEAFSLLY
jgi:hypothetical protein